LLKGMDASVIDRCLAERVALMPGARTLVRTMKEHGARAVLVSGGFTRFAKPVGAEIGFDHVVANVLELADGKLTGRVVEPVVDSATKAATLASECAALGIDVAEALAVGDGANDVPMLEAAGLGVAYHAHAAARAAADASVVHGDLTALLWAQGVPKREWRG
jgi:phosphoserine phosphatase